eukprot:TRINITY_DN7409_c0_g1_i2.p1 TRINITY_DN7409_c0_g1~~TRINITY_DN7409_c0_g1_i2.p1  ORF type:complete len:123 (-),score=18.86 TRINITY_DN7409_c0_g1_i2:55-423(-)
MSQHLRNQTLIIQFIAAHGDLQAYEIYDRVKGRSEDARKGCPNNTANLSEASGFALGLEEGEDISLADGALDVADDGAVGVVEEVDADLGDATTGAGAAEALCDAGELDLGVHVFSRQVLRC